MHIILETNRKDKHRGDTLGEKSSVRYTALEFNSDIVKGGPSSVWRYLSPRAIPITIFIRRVQDTWHRSPSAATLVAEV